MKARKILLLMSICMMTACTAAKEKPSPVMPVAQPMAYTEPAPTYSNPGSLYNPVDQLDLYSDGRARKVGDIVFVNIVENNTASNEASTVTSKSSTQDTGISSLFGMTSLPFAGQLGANMLSTSNESDFDGSGTTERSNSITATVGARVVRVMSDGLMQVEGARETRVNNETQYIVVMGLVRARDVQPDNSILSTHMADAQIQYYGSGIISDKQKPGWLTRILDNIWPL